MENEIERESIGGKRRKVETDPDSREHLIEEAKQRQFYDPLEKTFDYAKKRVTDLKECSDVFLPMPKDERAECEMEIIRNIMQEEFKLYKKKVEKEMKRRMEKGERINIDRNQESGNLTRKEKSGLKKLQKRIKNGEICIIKTDKSGKITAISKEDYLRMGNDSNVTDRKVDRKERIEIEKEINGHTRMLVKMFNMGENSNHLQRILDSKLTNSEQAAPKYYMFKDHKEGGGWRPVVSGCSSNTLGMSNLLSEIVESLCSAVENPYEVISSTDMLSRIEQFNREIMKKRIEKL